MLKVQAMTEGAQVKNDITAENNRLQGLLKVQELDAKQMQFRLSQQEKLMEEQRLAQEQAIEQARVSLEANRQVQESLTQAQPTIVIAKPQTIG